MPEGEKINFPSTEKKQEKQIFVTNDDRVITEEEAREEIEKRKEDPNWYREQE